MSKGDHNSDRVTCVLLMILLAGVSEWAGAGNIGIGTPTVEDGQVVLPIHLGATEEGVAALNFRLSYDANVFEPVGLQPGQAAQQASKQVTGNMPSPGDYVVVMMGFNQSTVNTGDVAYVTFRQIGESDGGLSRFIVQDTTLARWDGTEMPSEGGTRVVRLEDGQTETPENPETPETQDPGAPAPADQGPGTPAPERGRSSIAAPYALADEEESVLSGPRKPNEPADSGVPPGSKRDSSAGGSEDAQSRAREAREAVTAYAPMAAARTGSPGTGMNESARETLHGSSGNVSGISLGMAQQTVEQEQGEQPPSRIADESAAASGRRLAPVLAVGLLLVAVGLVLALRGWFSS